MTQKRSETDADRSLQDKAYDLLGEMLVERDTEKYLKELEEDIANGNTAEMEAFFAKQDKLNLKRIETYSRKQRNRRLLQHTIPHLAQVAAVIIAVIVLTGGVALATSKTVRVQVMRLLLNVEKEYTELSLVEDENASFDVPAEWQGSCFPAYIPERMEIFELVNGNLIVYRGDQDKKQEVCFSESDASTTTNLDTENASVRMIMIQGNSGYIAIKKNMVNIFWSDGLYYYIITTQNLEEDVAIRIAQSVRKIK